MCGTFEKLPESRKEEILLVCMEEFITNGYRNASTNTIVKRLGISKGLLFLYFKNKKSLYMYLVEHLSKYLTEEYFRRFGGSQALFIDVFNNIGDYYKEMLIEKPAYLLFMLEAFINSPAELRDEVEAGHSTAHETIFPHLSTEGLRDGIDPELLVNLLHIVSYYVGQMIFEDYKKEKELSGIDKEDIRKHIDKYEEMFLKYMDILRYGVYKTTGGEK
jgi:AcrR family transcriptional regulator